MNKYMHDIAKPSPKPNSKPTLVTEYSLKNGCDFTIVIDTHVPKQRNHHVFGDRVQRVLNEVQEFYKKNNQNAKSSKIVPHPSSIVKTIKLPLGDQQILNQDESKLIQEVYPAITQLKEWEKRRGNELGKNVWMQVKWKNSQIIDKVKVNYLREYETQLLDNYVKARQKIQQKYLKFMSSAKNIPKTKQQSVSQNNPYKIKSNFQCSKQNSQIQTTTNPHLIQIHSAQQPSQSRSSFHKSRNQNQSQTNEKLNQKKSSAQNNSDHRKQTFDQSINFFKRESSESIGKSYRQAQTIRKMQKKEDQNIDVKNLQPILNKESKMKNWHKQNQNSDKYIDPNNQQATKRQQKNYSDRRQSFLAKRPFPIIQPKTNFEQNATDNKNFNFLSKLLEIKHNLVPVNNSSQHEGFGSPTLSTKSVDTSSSFSRVSNSPQSPTFNFKNTVKNQQRKTNSIVQNKTKPLIVIEIDDD